MKGDYSIIYSAEAVDDIKAIYSYIAFRLKEPAIAKNQVNRIKKMIRSLDYMPMRYACVDWDPWKSMNIRKAYADNYVIFYAVDGESMAVNIVRIFYGGRDIQGIAAPEQEQ